MYTGGLILYIAAGPLKGLTNPPSPATDTQPLPLLPPNETRFDGLVYEEELLSGGKEKRGLGGGKNFF